MKEEIFELKDFKRLLGERKLNVKDVRLDFRDEPLRDDRGQMSTKQKVVNRLLGVLPCKECYDALQRQGNENVAGDKLRWQLIITTSYRLRRGVSLRLIC